MHKLTIEDDEGKTVVVPLIRDEITVGRQEGNSIRLTEKNISRRHARFFRQNSALFVEDLGSYNGIKVNGARISGATPLKDGDTVAIGDYRLTVRAERPSATVHYGSGAPFAGPPGGPAAPMVAAAPPAPAPPPEAALEGAPTIPVRTLAEQGLLQGQPLAPAMPPARLVVLSTNLAGAEFVIDRPSLVVGRTPENDIVLNHKSISRHHAKIIRDGDKYIVVDLESANGVRVNGVEFERVELQSTDLLELGHVRLRFVSGNEPVDFDADGLRGSSKKKVFGAVGVLAVAGVAFAMFSGDKSPGPQTVASSPAATPAPGAAPASGAAAPSPTTPAASPPPSTGAAESVEALLAKAKAAVSAENWAEAAAAVAKATQLAPPSAEMATLRDTIEGETQNAARFATLKRAVASKDHGAALEAYNGIEEGSVYRARATTIHQEVVAKVVAQHLAEAQQRHSRGECDEARKEAGLVLELDRENAAARMVIDRCDRLAARLAAQTAKPAREAPAPRQVVAARRDVPARREAAAARPAPAAPPAERPRPVAPPPEPVGDPDELIQEAQKAYLKGQHAAAIESARKALRARPNLLPAHNIIAASSCSLRDSDAAKRSYDKLDDRGKSLVRSVCAKNGISLE